jgi:hypothetical protein
MVLRVSAILAAMPGLFALASFDDADDFEDEFARS